MQQLYQRMGRCKSSQRMLFSAVSASVVVSSVGKIEDLDWTGLL
jgi:hypothetical protein